VAEPIEFRFFDLNEKTIILDFRNDALHFFTLLEITQPNDGGLSRRWVIGSEGHLDLLIFCIDANYRSAISKLCVTAECVSYLKIRPLTT
jgi:hypothetical protein